MGYLLLRSLFVISLILFLSLLFSSIDSAAQQLVWNPNTESDLAGYRVYYGTASRTYGTPVNVGNVTSCPLTGLSPGVTYYLAVTAYDTQNNESGFSNEVSYTPPCSLHIRYFTCFPVNRFFRWSGDSERDHLLRMRLDSSQQRLLDNRHF